MLEIKNHSFGVVAPIWVLVGVSICLVSLVFGVSLNDEALYTVWPYRFATGEKPYIDELSIQQGASFFIVPLIKAFLTIKSGTEGIIFFHRFAYFIFSILMAFCFGLLIKDQLRNFFPVLLAASLVFFLPWNIPAFSYNTLPMHLFTMGIFLHLSSAQERTWLQVLTGAIFCGCAISNPIYCVPLTVGLVLSLLFFRSQTLRVLPKYILGVILVVFLFSPYLVNLIYADSIWETTSQSGSGAINIVFVLYYFLRSQPGKLWFLALFIIGLLFKKRSTNLGAIFLIVGPFIISSHYRGLNAHLFLNSFGCFGPLYYFCLPHKNSYDRILMRFVWPTSLVAAAAIAWSSTNGFNNSSFGFLPASLVTMFFLVKLAQYCVESFNKNWPLTLSVGVLISIQVVFISARYYPYTEGAFFYLKEKVQIGPFKGLYTSQEKKDLLAEANALLESEPLHSDGIIFYEHFPAGYLMTKLRPLAYETWQLSSPVEFKKMLNIRRLKSFVSVRVFYPMNRAWFRVNLPEKSSLDLYLETLSCPGRTTKHFQILNCSTANLSSKPKLLN